MKLGTYSSRQKGRKYDDECWWVGRGRCGHQWKSSSDCFNFFSEVGGKVTAAIQDE